MSNNSNAYDLDARQVRSAIDEATGRATVLDVLPDIHAVRVNPRGDNSPLLAPVVTPMYGSVMLPDEGERVTLLYIAENIPVCIGANYLIDGEDPPSAEVGDLVLGNGSGSEFTIDTDGQVGIITEGNKPVDIDIQTCSLYMETDQTISNSGSYNNGADYTKVQYDGVEDDNDNLYQQNDYSVLARFGGLYQIHATVEIPNPQQNNLYGLAIFVNGSLVKRRVRQSTVNEPISLHVMADQLLSADDVIHIGMFNGSGSNKTLNGDPTASEFSINRTGRAR